MACLVYQCTYWSASIQEMLLLRMDRLGARHYTVSLLLWFFLLIGKKNCFFLQWWKDQGNWWRWYWRTSYFTKAVTLQKHWGNAFVPLIILSYCIWTWVTCPEVLFTVFDIDISYQKLWIIRVRLWDFISFFNLYKLSRCLFFPLSFDISWRNLIFSCLYLCSSFFKIKDT